MASLTDSREHYPREHTMTTDPTSATRNRTGVAARPAPGQAMQDRRFNVKGWLLWTAARLPHRRDRGPGGRRPDQ